MGTIPVDEIMRLPVEDRLRLAEVIWDSVRSNPDGLPLSDAQRAELDRRLEVYRSDPRAGDDPDTVLARFPKSK